MTVKTDSTTPTIDFSAEGLQELGERTVQESRKASLTAVEAYEKAGLSIAALQSRTAKTSQLDWLTGLLDAQADLTRTVVSAQAGAARSILS